MNAGILVTAAGGAADATVRLPRHLARWRQLMTPAWLAAWLGGEPVEAAPAAQWCLLEVGWEGAAAFVQSHIPGAGYLDTEALEGGPWWNKVDDETLLALLLRLGIRHDTTVLLYGRNTLCATRAALLLLYAGVKDVRLLDGGYAAWTAGGHPVAAGEPAAAPPAPDFGAPFPGGKPFVIDLPEARERLRRSDGALVSIRTWAEHVGATSGYAYITRKGDIPGARWGRAGRDGDTQCMAHYQRADGRMRPPAEIEAFWLAAGIDRGQRNTFYCGTGWRASLAFFYAWLMGWDDISVYDGGWFEWSSVPAGSAGGVPCGIYALSLQG